ncbi:hypothetical protein TGAM01_v210000 [Trichoderma gamsii]|uniref:Uncharacterized protein n=1 Tax=Trichoderma gamsii TaxID=398673 RepID=A0A2P4ZA51_9HYPO|nr:hypothetical protein TGAM01_v210000 [Trichoderma gamsii]PON21152.1 hypothetical protein TGAM01_v210000 [Trichoderma gamsii]
MAAASHRQLTFTPPGHRRDPNSRPRPVSASVLASIEKQRRDFVRGLGPCRSGCEDLDNYVLLAGGFERGSVVGISAENEDGVGVMLGLQVLACSLLDSAAQRVQVITPKPPSTIVVLLKNALTAELKARGVSKADEVAARRRDCLDRIMLSRVFDMDGLDEVLADLDATAAAPGGGKEEEQIIEIQSAEETAALAVRLDPTAADVGGDGAGDDAASNKEEKPQEASAVAEIQDSQDDEDETPSPPPSPISLPQPPQPHADDNNIKDTTATITTATTATATEPGNHSIPNRQVDSESNNDKPTTTTAYSTPDIILITHFSSVLTGFFTQRDKSAAHAALRLLATRLRHLSRTLPSHPLILLLNSTDSGAHASESHNHENHLHMNSIPLPLPDQQSLSSTAYRSATSSTDPTLRSIFNPAHHASTSYKANKPTFGLVFTQLLDLHLLCTRSPRPSRAAPSSLRAMTVVEVLLDEIGLWEGERGQRKRREQRWTIVALRNGRMVSVSGSGRRIETQGDD